MSDPTPPKAFVEAWLAAHPGQRQAMNAAMDAWLGDHGALWRAARAAAFEECATIAEDAHNPPPPAGNDRRWRVAHEIAAAIRERAKETT